jgi:hypothetical protein
MSDIKSEPTVIDLNVPTTKTQEFKDIYSNHNRIGVSPVDFNITFSKIVEGALGLSSIEDQVVIRMSPQQFKGFLESASRTMAAWEEVYGKIKETVKTPSQSGMAEGIRRLKDALDKANS